MKIIKVNKLRDITAQILVKAGASPNNAGYVSESLVNSNLYGVDTHGVHMLPYYIEQIKKEELNPKAEPELVKDNGSSALVKGNWSFGQVTAKFATDIAIARAKNKGISIVGGVQVMHTGRLAEYVGLAASQQTISFMWTGGFSEEGAAVAVPYGGRQKVLHTNPIAMGFPTHKLPIMISDFATTMIAVGKIMMASAEKELLPAGCIIDKNGNPSQNPKDFFQGGGLLPFGNHKGYALMLAAEFMGRILTDSDSYMDNNKKQNVFPGLKHSGFSILAIKPDLFCSFEEYNQRIMEMGERVRKSASAPGFSEVQIPGDKERAIYEKRLKEGIPISSLVWDSLIQIGRSFNINI